jgi:hypothetical protein
MNTVGAVSRGINSVWIDPRYDTINYASGEFPLSWKCYSEAKEFEFALYMPDNLATPFYKKDVNKLKIQISEFIGKLKPGTQYRWTSSAKEEDENDNLPVFNYVTKATFDELLAKIKAQGASFEAPAEQAYRIGFMLEDARYLAEAYQYYTKATTLAPDNALYRSTLMSFKKDYEIK